MAGGCQGPSPPHATSAPRDDRPPSPPSPRSLLRFCLEDRLLSKHSSAGGRWTSEGKGTERQPGTGGSYWRQISAQHLEALREKQPEQTRPEADGLRREGGREERSQRGGLPGLWLCTGSSTASITWTRPDLPPQPSLPPGPWDLPPAHRAGEAPSPSSTVGSYRRAYPTPPLLRTVVGCPET